MQNNQIAECAENTAKIMSRFESETLLDDVLHNSERTIALYDNADIRDYEVVKQTNGRIGFNYDGIKCFLNDCGFIRYEYKKDFDPRYYQYNSRTGYYSEVSEDYILNYVCRCINNLDLKPDIPTSFKINMRNMVFPNLWDVIEDGMYEMPEFIELKKYYTEGEVIPFKNGWYSMKYNRFLPRTSCIFELKPLNVDFNPESIRSTIASKYEEMMTDDISFEYLMELIGYIIYARSVNIPTYVVLYGSGANGKSIVVDTVSRIIGGENISRLTLEMMVNTYLLTECDGKLANIVADAGTGYRDTTYQSISLVPAFMKSAAAGEMWQFNPKHRKPYVGKPCSKFLFASNNYLNLGDSSDGTVRRMQAVPFCKTFANDNVLANRFKKKEETEWFALRALIGYFNVIHNYMHGAEFDEWETEYNGCFIQCDTGSEKKKSAIISANSLYDYLSSTLEVNILDTKAVSKAIMEYEGFEEDLYHDFVNYCYETGRKKVSLVKLNQELEKFGVQCIRQRYRDGVNLLSRYAVIRQ